MNMNNDEIEIRTGAIAAIDAMKIIEQIAESGSPEWSIDDCQKAQNTAVSSAILAAGNIPNRAKGVITALAEYIYSYNSAGQPNLEIWKPEAAMTSDELIAHLSSMQELFEQ